MQSGLDGEAASVCCVCTIALLADSHNAVCYIAGNDDHQFPTTIGS